MFKITFVLMLVAAIFSFSRAAEKAVKRKVASTSPCMNQYKFCVSKANPDEASGYCNQASIECQKLMPDDRKASFNSLKGPCDKLEKDGGSLALASANYCRATLAQYILSY